MNQKVGYLSSTKQGVKLIKLASIILVFLALAFSILFSQPVFSEVTELGCDSGYITTDGDPLYLVIRLNCPNIASFAHSGTDSADSVDILSFELYKSEVFVVRPYEAIINGDILSLRFNTTDDVLGCDIKIAAGLLFDSGGSISNAAINIQGGEIKDEIPPVAINHQYSVDVGMPLLVTSENGLLSVGDGFANSTGTCANVTGPQPGGELLLNENDGSFTFTQDEEYTGEYQFSYIITDENGNISQATVTISTPKIELNYERYYKVNGVGSGVKVGDVLRANVVSTLSINNKTMSATINGNAAYIDVVDETHFSIYRVMTEDDKEIKGVNFFVSVIDELRRESIMSIESNYSFDKTKPVIHLNDDVEVYLDIGNPYEDPVTVTDNFDHSLEVIIEGSVNPDIVGAYQLRYYAFDIAGNKSETAIRTVYIIDPINDRFDDIALAQEGFGLSTNLGNITSANVDIFSGLYLESSVDGRLIGRITFDGLINLNDEELMLYLQDIDKYISMDEVGNIGLNFLGQNENLIFRNLSATIKFYNLDKLGYTKKSKAADIFAKLTVTDEDGNVIDKNLIADAPGIYVGCGGHIYECYTYTLHIKHFTNYRIGMADINKFNDELDLVSVIAATPNNPIVLAANISLRTDDVVVVEDSTEKPNTQTINVDPTNETRELRNSTILGFEWYWWLLFAALAVIVIWSLLGW